MVLICLILFSLIRTSNSSVISSLALAITSPVSSSTRLSARILPQRKSSGTTSDLTLAFFSCLIYIAVIRRPCCTSTLPLTLISKVAVSPFSQSACNTMLISFFLILNTLWSKNISSICTVSKPSARNKMVAGNLRRRSMRTNSESLGSNSKSSQEPR